MPLLNSRALLAELEATVNELILTAEQRFGSLSPDQLNQPPTPQRWSIAQCLEHLNSYGRYYLPLLDTIIRTGEDQPQTARPEFRSSWLGNYFVETMRPKADGRIALPMKAVREHTPPAHLNTTAVLAEFFEQQHQLLDLCDGPRTLIWAG